MSGLVKMRMRDQLTQAGRKVASCNPVYSRTAKQMDLPDNVVKAIQTAQTAIHEAAMALINSFTASEAEDCRAKLLGEHIYFEAED